MAILGVMQFFIVDYLGVSECERAGLHRFVPRALDINETDKALKGLLLLREKDNEYAR